jgi:hypothetical protein
MTTTALGTDTATGVRATTNRGARMTEHTPLPEEADQHTGPGPDAPEGGWQEDDLVDEMSEESFPTSDPPSTWAG